MTKTTPAPTSYHIDIRGPLAVVTVEKTLPAGAATTEPVGLEFAIPRGAVVVDERTRYPSVGDRTTRPTIDRSKPFEGIVRIVVSDQDPGAALVSRVSYVTNVDPSTSRLVLPVLPAHVIEPWSLAAGSGERVSVRAEVTSGAGGVVVLGDVDDQGRLDADGPIVVEIRGYRPTAIQGTMADGTPVDVSIEKADTSARARRIVLVSGASSSAQAIATDILERLSTDGTKVEHRTLDGTGRPPAIASGVGDVVLVLGETDRTSPRPRPKGRLLVVRAKSADAAAQDPPADYVVDRSSGGAWIDEIVSDLGIGRAVESLRGTRGVRKIVAPVRGATMDILIAADAGIGLRDAVGAYVEGVAARAREAA